MISVEELAEGIIEITNRGIWDQQATIESVEIIAGFNIEHRGPAYVMLNMLATTDIEREHFANLAAQFDNKSLNVGMAIMVGQRAHLLIVRNMESSYPSIRHNKHLRLMTDIADAYRFLLDRQVMDRMNGIQIVG